MAEKPNIVFLFPDQQRPDFLSCYGAQFIHTPHIDSLTHRGIQYTRAYSPHPLCVPARVSLLTGMNAVKTGVLSNRNFLRPNYQAQGIRLWPEILRERGYTTAAIGKMHFYPWNLQLGFQDRVIAEDKRWIHIQDDYARYLHRHGYRKQHGNEYPNYHKHKGAVYSQIPWEHTVDRFIGDATCQYLRARKESTPFALMVGFPGPHCPYDPIKEIAHAFNPLNMPEPINDSIPAVPRLVERNIEGNRQPWNGIDYSDFTTDQQKKIRAHYAGLVKQIDIEVGRILATIEECNLQDNTIIIYASDHGDYLGDHQMVGKGSFYESCIHIPLIIQLPWLADPHTDNTLVSLNDLTATLLSLTGCSLPSYLDSQPLPLPGIPHPQPRDYIIGMLEQGWMIFDGEWRLAKYATGESVLFNLHTDPHEQFNRFHDPQCSQVIQRLDQLLTTQILFAIAEANYDCVVDHGRLYQDQMFGNDTWQRPYPTQWTNSETT